MRTLSLVPDDENRRGVLSKAKGQTIARIALALHVLEEALQQLEPDPQTNKDWSFVIEDATLQRAVELINHFVEQKFTLMRSAVTAFTPIVYHHESSSKECHQSLQEDQQLMKVIERVQKAARSSWMQSFSK